MFSSAGSNPQGFDRMEALRHANPEMAGAIDVAFQRQAVTAKCIENTYRAAGIMRPSFEGQRHEETQNYSPVEEAESILREEERQKAALGADARQQLQAMPDYAPSIAPVSPPADVAPVSEVQSQVSYISQIADNHYNHFSGMN